MLQVLRREIAAGRWPKWMPTERVLSEQLQVSRRTIRSAMAQLSREGIVSSHVGLGTRVLKRLSQKTSTSFKLERSVGLLTPEPIDSLQPYLMLWIDHLKSLLFNSGITLDIHTGHQFFRKGGGGGLQRLLKQHSHACWVLALSNETVQRWFCENKIPTIVAGMLHPGIDLPTVYLDTHALGKHATGHLLAAGHSKLLFLSELHPSPGAAAAECGFTEEVQRTSSRGVRGEVWHLEAEPQVYRRVVEKLLRQPSRVTGIVCLNPLAGATVVTALMRNGVRIPDDVSVITTYGDPFMRFLSPEPTRYSYRPNVFAKKIDRIVSQIVSGVTLTERSVRLMPSFIKGETLAPSRRIS